MTHPYSFVILLITMKKRILNKYFGDKAFYAMVLAVAVPIIIQNGISNFVNLLDNIMVGKIGTEQMSGVAIVNQLMFVFNLALFGVTSGPGIFTAQYFGQKNNEGVKHTFRFKLLASVLVSLAGIGLMILKQDMLISLFLTDTTGKLDIAATLAYAKDYLYVMLWGLVPFAITCSYTGTLREAGETKLPMISGLVAVGVNLVLNALLIFGLLGLPKLGVVGAAVATVISRFVELLIVIIWTHTHKEKAPYAVGLYKGFYMPAALCKKIIITGTPLFLNEFMWSMGMSAVTQCYSTRGLEVIAAFNISNTIVNLFNVALISMGNVVAIIVGQILGSENRDEAVDVDRKLIVLSVLSTALLAIILIITAPLFPLFFNTTQEIRDLSVVIMRIAALFMPVGAYLNSAYFTIRSGGKTFITFLFDSAYLWVICFPIAFVLSRFTSIEIIPMYALILSLDFIKVGIGAFLLKKRIWVQNLVDEK